MIRQLAECGGVDHAHVRSVISLTEARDAVATTPASVLVAEAEYLDKVSSSEARNLNVLRPLQLVVFSESSSDETLARLARRWGAQAYWSSQDIGSIVMRRDIDRIIRQAGLADSAESSAEQALMVDRRHRSLAEEVGDGVLVVDQAGRVCFMNQSAEALLSCSADDLIGQELGIPISGQGLNEVDFVDRAGERTTVELQVVETIWQSEPAYLASLRDVTERKLAQLALQEANTELRQSNAELEEFSHVVSHDLKTPLLSIQGFANCLAEDVSEGAYGKLPHYCDRILSASERINRIIDDLLKLSQTGRTQDTPEPIDMSALAREITRELEWTSAARSIEINIQDDMPRLMIDRIRATEIIENLLSNAIKYGCTDEKPCVRVSGRVAGDKGEVQYFVSDNGNGIPSRYHDMVFELFTRLQRDSQDEGTGIGLAIVKRAVEARQGRIWIESEQGRGTTFCVAFPQSMLCADEDV